MVEILSASEIEKMRRVGRIANELLKHLEEFVVVGRSTIELDSAASRLMKRYGVRSSQLGYRGFTGHICTSRNEVVCHGVPSETEILQEGDIVNLDLTVEKNGFHADTSKTFGVGSVSKELLRLLDGAQKSLEAAVSVVKEGARIGDIGAAVLREAECRRLSVVREYCGHGIGRKMHLPPEIPHVGQAGRGLRLQKGMAFTIEPMLNLGTARCRLKKDGWTVVTSDGAYSAQFEHTVLVTEHGCEVLTGA